MEEVENLTDKQRYDFKKALEEIKDLHGRGTELISVYVPPDRQIFDVAAYLRNEYSQSSNIKSKSTRKNVMGAIDSIMSRLKYFRQPPENGLIFFVGEVAAQGDQTRMVQYVLEPPEPITTFIYRCDSDFYIEPLWEILAEKKSYGLIVIDRSEATLGLLRGKRINIIKNIPSLVPSKHGKGGQSAQRFERLIEIAAHEFFVKTADIATDAFLDEDDLQGILVGGPGPTKDYFVEKNFLHHELQKKVIDTFDIGYTDEYGLRELVEKAQDKLQDMDLMREKKLIQRLLHEIRKPDGGLSAYGEDQVRHALELGAVDTLLLSEGLRKDRVVVDCPNCGWKGRVNVDKRRNSVKCVDCEAEVEELEGVDLIDDFFEEASKVGTHVELISEDSEEGEMLMKAFGGIAAILRFNIGG
ncbi:MAG: peptide chain release factor 1 [Methanomassiliicoccales archaeon]|nr:peptide chain release factor 1 [Methanomassiliicoccales archaeon]NYT14718.1 peptide chain release factor 1 [Methanomassiliicoccales archaeon]